MLHRVAAMLIAVVIGSLCVTMAAQAKDPWKHSWKEEQKRDKAYHKYERKQAKRWEKHQRKQARYWYR